jgi:hypothetical protein
LASTAVKPAKNAESNAHRNQFMRSPYVLPRIQEKAKELYRVLVAHASACGF